MRQQTVLILDGQQHRGGMLEQGLTGRGYHVFRTSRSREASKLLHVLQPHFVVLSLEGEGQEFYLQSVQANQVGSAQCIVLMNPGQHQLRPQDQWVNVGLSSAMLIDDVVEKFDGTSSMDLSSSSPSVSQDKTLLGMEPFDPSTFQPAVPVRVKSPLPQAAASSPSMEQVSLPPPTLSLTPVIMSDKPWEGSLSKMDVARVFSGVARQQLSGRFELQNGNEVRTLWFDRGNVINANSNYPLESYVTWLVSQGIIAAQDADQYPALGMPEGPQMLVNLNLVTAQELHGYRKAYVEYVILSCFDWNQGKFLFNPVAEFGVEPLVSLPLPPMILRGVRINYDTVYLQTKLSELGTVPQWFANQSPDEVLPLIGNDKRIVQKITGHDSLASIAQQLNLPEQELFPLLYVLVLLGYVRMRGSNDIAASPGLPTRSASQRVTSSAPQNAGFLGEFSADAVGARPTPEGPLPSFGSEGQLKSGSNMSVTPQPAITYRSVPPSRPRPNTAQMRAFQHPTTSGDAMPDAQLQAIKETIESKYRQVMVLNYFKILEISAEANDGEIRRSFQQLKHKYAEERYTPEVVAMLEMPLQEIRQVLEEAYSVLGDPQLRSRYLANLGE